MTTTELIALLKQHEFGAVTDQSRTVNIYTENQYGDEVLVFGGENDTLKSIGGGDGIGGASLDLRAKCFFTDNAANDNNELAVINKALIARIQELEEMLKLN